MKVNAWVLFNCRFAQASIPIDVSEYTSVIKNRFYDLMARQESERDRLSKTVPLSPRVILDNLRNAGYTNLADVEKAIASGDSSLLSDSIWDVNQFWRQNKKQETSMQISVSFKALRDMERKIDLDNHQNDITEELCDIEVAKLTQETIEKMQPFAEKVQGAISSLGDQWNGAVVSIVADTVDSTMDLQSSETCHVFVGSGNDAPSFMFFMDNGKVQIDDIIEGGDEDFFSSSQLQADYFNLISAIQNSGAPKRKKRIPALYTARPVKDRQMYNSTKQLPANIFLTNQFDHAMGLANDLGGSEIRDVWEVYLESGNGLIRTLDPSDLTDNPSKLQYYQTTMTIPVKAIYLVQEGKTNSKSTMSSPVEM